MKNLGHLMLDLETMGNKVTAPIVSIGAVEFDIKTGETGREFYRLINLQSSLDLGTKPQGDTILWWLQQSENARKKLYENKGINIRQAMFEYNEFVKTLGVKDLCIWGNSNRFDIGIIAYTMDLLKMEYAWKYALERDVRTLVSFAPQYKTEEIFKGVLHNPIDDCKYQIKYCSTIYNKIKIL